MVKYQAEVLLLAFDYGSQDEIALNGETISSINSITFTPAGLTLNVNGAAVIAGSQVRVWVSAGVSGQSYVGVCLITTSGGKVLESRMSLSMLD